MALNPPVMSVGGQPMGLWGETFILLRQNVHVKLDRPGAPHALTGKGTLYVSTLRCCLVFSQLVDGVHAFDLPLQGLVGTPEFKQPVFGANYLEGLVAPVPGRGLDGTGPSPVRFRLTFNNGVGTFLKAFYRLHEAYVRQDAAARAAFLDPAQAQAWTQTLFAAQSSDDPSVLYIQGRVAQPPSEPRQQFEPTRVGGFESAGPMPVGSQREGPPGVNPAYARLSGV
jgi:hypothetical protein